MIRPSVRSRIEESHDGPGRPVHGGDIRTLKTIAWETGIRQIAQVCRTTVLSADDVIDLVPIAAIIFVNQTIFAALVSPLCYAEP
jgi:hypothetical protein